MPQPDSPLSRPFRLILTGIAVLIVILVLVLLVRAYAG